MESSMKNVQIPLILIYPTHPDICLGQLAPSDAPVLADLLTTQPDHHPKGDSLFESSPTHEALAKNLRDPDHLSLGIWMEGHTLIGFLHLQRHTGAWGELSVWVAPSFGNKGYATSSVTAFMRYISCHEPVRYVEARITPGDIAYQAVLKHTGFIPHQDKDNAPVYRRTIDPIEAIPWVIEAMEKQPYFIDGVQVPIKAAPHYMEVQFHCLLKTVVAHPPRFIHHVTDEYKEILLKAIADHGWDHAFTKLPRSNLMDPDLDTDEIV